MEEINLIPKEYKGKKADFRDIFSKTGGIVLGLLILSLLVFGGLLLYKNKIQGKLDEVKQNIVNLDAKRNSNEELAIYYADKKLNIVEGLFRNHFYWSKLFTKIQELTVPEVYFSDFKSSFLNEKLEVDLNGHARTYTALAKQMVGFKEDSSVEKISLRDTSLSEAGGIEFGFSIIFKKDILTVLIPKTEKND